MITITTLSGTEIDIQASAVIAAREPHSADPDGTGAVLVYKLPTDAKPFKELKVQEDIYDIAAQDATLFVTEDLAPDNEVLLVVRQQERVVAILDNDADPVQYQYNDEGMEPSIRTHNGDYASFMAQYDGNYSPSASPSPSGSPS